MCYYGGFNIVGFIAFIKKVIFFRDNVIKLENIEGGNKQLFDIFILYFMDMISCLCLATAMLFIKLVMTLNELFGACFVLVGILYLFTTNFGIYLCIYKDSCFIRKGFK